MTVEKENKLPWLFSDVKKLIEGVLDVSPKTWDNPNGRDTTTCPFCLNEEIGGWLHMSEITHEKECPWLIAKDMNSGL